MKGATIEGIREIIMWMEGWKVWLMGDHVREKLLIDGWMLQDGRKEGRESNKGRRESLMMMDKW